MSVLAVRDALNELDVAVYHYAPVEEKGKYIVWHEQRTSDTQYGDDGIAGQSIAGIISFVTDEEYDPLVDRIQYVLAEAGVSFRLVSVIYDRTLRLIQYQWSFDVDCGDGIYAG